MRKNTKKNKLSAEENKTAKKEKAEARASVAQELQIHQRHAELQREIQYGAQAIKRHAKKWRSMLERIANSHIRRELEYTWHAFEYIVDAKDLTISLLLDELKQADEQYDNKIRSQVDNIDRLITLYFDQINDVWDESRDAIAALYKAGTFERNSVLEIVRDHDDYLRTMLYGQDEQRKESIKSDRGAHLSAIGMENSKLLDSTMKYICEMRFMWDRLWGDAQIFRKEYSTEFSQRKQKFMALEALEAEQSEGIKTRWDLVEKSYIKIKRLKAQLTDLETGDNKIALDRLVRRAKYYETEFRKVQTQIKTNRSIDADMLTTLSIETNQVLDCLQCLEKKGKKLLALSGVCRKLETIDEKTMAFPTFEFKVTKKERAKIEEGEEVEDEDDVQGNVMKNLKLFWNRVANVEVSRYKLQEKCDVLRKENEMLKTQVFNYCECLNCEPQVQFLYEHSSVFQKPK